MKDYQKRSKWRKIMQTKPFLFFLGILILFFSFNMVVFLRKMNDAVEKRELVEQRIDELEATKIKLNQDIEKLKTDRGLEENIREKFGLTLPGEELVIIVEEDSEKIENEEVNKGFFETIKSWFK